MTDTFDEEAAIALGISPDTEQTPAPSVPQPGPPPDFDFEAALAEWETATKSTEPPQEGEAVEDIDLDRSLSEYELAILRRNGVNPSAASDAEIMKAFAGDSLRNVYNAQRDKLISFAQDLQRKVDIIDFHGTLDDVRASCPAAEGLSDTVIGAYLMHMADTSPGTKRDWDNRYASPRQWGRRIEKLSQQLGQQVQPPIDPDLTADRLAISQLMRGATRTTQAERSMPANLSSLSNKEFVARSKPGALRQRFEFAAGYILSRGVGELSALASGPIALGAPP